MSTCNHEKQDRFANCCKLASAEKTIAELQERIKVFPQPVESKPDQPTINTVVEFPLDPRAMLAGFAMAGMLSHSRFLTPSDAARASVSFANALMMELRE